MCAADGLSLGAAAPPAIDQGHVDANGVASHDNLFCVCPTHNRTEHNQGVRIRSLMRRASLLPIASSTEISSVTAGSFQAAYDEPNRVLAEERRLRINHRLKPVDLKILLFHEALALKRLGKSRHAWDALCLAGSIRLNGHDERCSGIGDMIAAST